MKKYFLLIMLAIAFLSCCHNKPTVIEDINMERADEFSPITPEEIAGNVIQMISNEWMLITVGNQEKYNTMTASWGMMGELWGKPVTACFIRPQRFTYEFIENSEYYTLCFFDSTYHQALEFCGTKSGRDYPDQNKAEAAGLTPAYTENGAVYFKESYLVIECKKIYAQQFQKEFFVTDEITNPDNRLYPTLDELHKAYIGEIVKVLYRK
ncbi:MAG: flavin reductase [Bacteroidales bacterium]|jgi:flavin reductase (DIM6/NTAB) family NADH-FMN oxidoreductase RutF|nr:flavin reductase [Bacteroidales bacterium]